jgi:hypothetical protein
MRALLVIDLRDWRGPASPGAERAERAFRHRMAEAINSAANSIQLGAPAGTITREGVVGHFVLEPSSEPAADATASDAA